jgi:hypothetical protein
MVRMNYFQLSEFRRNVFSATTRLGSSLLSAVFLTFLLLQIILMRNLIS